MQICIHEVSREALDPLYCRTVCWLSYAAVATSVGRRHKVWKFATRLSALVGLECALRALPRFMVPRLAYMIMNAVQAKALGHKSLATIRQLCAARHSDHDVRTAILMFFARIARARDTVLPASHRWGSSTASSFSSYRNGGMWMTLLSREVGWNGVEHGPCYRLFFELALVTFSI